MKWTSEPPTVLPGYYWYKSEWVSPKGIHYPFSVIKLYGKGEEIKKNGDTDRWAGPIPEPEE